MPPSQAQVSALYEVDKERERLPMQHFTNRDLVNKFEHLTDPLRLSAAIFLRPVSAMKYNLLPALAEKLAYQKPWNGNSGKPVNTPEEGIVRSISVLLDLADPDWNELPDNWVSLGSVLDNHDVAMAREFLDAIFAQIALAKPMEFLRKYCEKRPDHSLWMRNYELSADELRHFLTDERAEALKRIENADL